MALPNGVVNKSMLLKNPYLKMLLATVLLGSYLIAGKIVLRETPVFTASLIRLSCATLFLLPIILIRFKASWLWPSKKDGLLLLIQSMFGVFLFSIFAMYGVRLTGGIESGIMLSLVPIAATVVSVLFLKEILNRRRIVGIVLAVLGAASISVFSNTAAPDQDTSLLGLFLLFCAVLCEAIFLTFGKLLQAPLAPEKLSFILALVAALLFVIPASLEPNGILNAHYSWQTWALMIYTGIAINGLAVILVYSSMEKIDTSVAVAFTALTPVSGTVLSMIFLNETLHFNHLSGMVLASVGVFIVASAKSNNQTYDDRG